MRFSLHVFRLILVLLILIPGWSHAAEKYKEVSRELLPLIDRSDILILGETHGREESTRLLAKLADEATQGGGCLTIALEIGSEQQSVIDRVMSGTAEVAEIVVVPVIDHVGYREMLAALSRFMFAGRCLTVIAIDGEPEVIERDAWMAEKLVPFLGEGRLVALIGALHAAKDIRWDNGREKAFLAEKLMAKGYAVCSVQQMWDEGEVGVSPLTLDDVAEILDPVAARLPEKAREFGDYAVRWMK